MPKNICLSIAFLFLLGACGTNTVFDYTVPSIENTEQPKDLQSAGEIAGQYAARYRARAGTIASSVQLFDVPIIAAAATGVTALAFDRRGVSDLALGAGLAGATIAAVGNYYAPRERSRIYASASSAMGCIATLVGSNLQLEGMRPEVASFSAVPTRGTSDSVARARRSVAQFTGASLSQLVSDVISAINAINTSIQAQSLNASSRPDYNAISSQVAQTARQAQRDRNVAEVLEVDSRLLSAIILISDFRSQLTICKALAGAT